MDLYDELQNPTPRGPLETWMERNSSFRYVMMATLAGVLIAVLLGILSLAVSIFLAAMATSGFCLIYCNILGTLYTSGNKGLGVDLLELGI